MWSTRTKTTTINLDGRCLLERPLSRLLTSFELLLSIFTPHTCKTRTQRSYQPSPHRTSTMCKIQIHEYACRHTRRITLSTCLFHFNDDQGKPLCKPKPETILRLNSDHACGPCSINEQDHEWFMRLARATKNERNKLDAWIRCRPWFWPLFATRVAREARREYKVARDARRDLEADAEWMREVLPEWTRGSGGKVKKRARVAARQLERKESLLRREVFPEDVV